MHPDLGRLRLNYEVLLLPDDVDEQRLITWLPADEATASHSPAPATLLFHRAPRSSASSTDGTRTGGTAVLERELRYERTVLHQARSGRNGSAGRPVASVSNR